MDKIIREIIDELIKDDAGLKAREQELVRIISEIKAAAPEFPADPAWKERLKRELIAPKSASQIRPGYNFFNLIYKNMNTQKLAYAIGGALAAIIVVVPAVFFYVGSRTGGLAKNALSEPQFFSRDKFSDLKEGAFGPLAVSGTGKEADLKAPLAMGGAETMPAGRGGGGDAKIGMPAFMDYRFEYKGEEFAAPEAKMEVLKRVKESPGAAELASSIKSMDFGLINMGKLSQAKMQSFSILEDREYGYIMGFNYEDGSVNIYENYPKWHVGEEQCLDQACFDRQRIRISDFPADGEVLALAEKFAQDYEIDLTGYGEPKVDDMWRQDYERSQNKDEYYLPEVVNVIFPYKVGDSIVYDESGNSYGLNVSVNIKKNKVSSAYNLVSRNYQRSEYVSETDTGKIISVAEKGGFRRYFGLAEDSKVPAVELGTPSIAYMQYYQYANNQNNELLVPAYVFPITKVPEGVHVWMKNVIVPIPAELLKEGQGSDVMPLMKTEPSAIDGAEPAKAEEAGTAR